MREVHQWSCKCFDTSKAHFRTPLFAIVLQTIFRQMFKLVDFQLDQYVLWSSFSFSSVTIWALCALQTSFNQHGSSVILTRTCSNTPNSEFINMNRVYNGCQTHKTHHLQGNPWLSMVFIGLHGFSEWWHCSSSWSALVPHGSSHPEDVPGATELTWSSYVILTVGGLVSNTSDVNEWRTRGACGNQG